MKVVVVGGAGYVGAVLVPMLLENGHDVTVIDRLIFETPFGKPTLSPDVRVIKKDTRAVDVGDFYGVERVIDLAGISNDPSCDLAPSVTIDFNFRGGINVARQAHLAGVAQYVYASSCAVYGQATGECDEDSALDPLSEYARSKVAMELALRRMWGAPTHTTRGEIDKALTIFRFATVYGLSPRMRFDLAPNLMALRAWQKQPIEIWSKPGIYRPFVHVRDVARILTMNSMRHFWGTFNLGSDDMTMTIRDLAWSINARHPASIVDKVNAADARSYRPSFERLGLDTGRFKFTELGDGIDEIVTALDEGRTRDGIMARTVDRYKHLIEQRCL